VAGLSRFWLNETNQINQTDRTCLRRADPRRSAVPTWSFRSTPGSL